jgi:uncharacterized protein (TIGR02284 family)
MNDYQDNKALRAINDLVETCRDGMKGYETAAENVSNPQIKSELSRLAQQRAGFVNELENRARQYGMDPEEKSTLEGAALEAAGAVHRGWINLKSAISGNSSTAILNECENGDAAALKTYEQALQVQDLPEDIRNVVERQHHDILEAKNRITMLKQSV